MEQWKKRIANISNCSAILYKFGSSGKNVQLQNIGGLFQWRKFEKKYKGLVTHNDILKIYRIIQYSRNIFKCNNAKNILKIYKKITFLLKKISSV